ncbi:hypothetical protein FGO68_gene12083 [Halteria grandinella]|uniref:Transmembrane protein n=1 Tax=Halteria grandinella TaxID=5974 RepID=A0A8J8T0H3_HALGN|nr:hypothetical protein FGO68_gene12083 [Halteria grandinella]
MGQSICRAPVCLHILDQGKAIQVITNIVIPFIKICLAQGHQCEDFEIYSLSFTCTVIQFFKFAYQVRTLTFLRLTIEFTNNCSIEATASHLKLPWVLIGLQAYFIILSSEQQSTVLTVQICQLKYFAFILAYRLIIPCQILVQFQLSVRIFYYYFNSFEQ